MIATVSFYVFAAVLLGSAGLVVTARNPVHAVLFLILAFFNAAALFLIAGAEFLAMILVVVYVGAVAVLFLFVVMMLDIDSASLRGGLQRYYPAGASIGAVLLVELLLFVSGHAVGAVTLASPPAAKPTPMTNTAALGRLLYTDDVFLFQMAGLVLLVAMIGAIVLTLRDRRTSRRQDVSVQVNRDAERTVSRVSMRLGEGVALSAIHRPIHDPTQEEPGAIDADPFTQSQPVRVAGLAEQNHP